MTTLYRTRRIVGALVLFAFISGCSSMGSQDSSTSELENEAFSLGVEDDLSAEEGFANAGGGADEFGDEFGDFNEPIVDPELISEELDQSGSSLNSQAAAEPEISLDAEPELSLDEEPVMAAVAEPEFAAEPEFSAEPELEMSLSEQAEPVIPAASTVSSAAGVGEVSITDLRYVSKEAGGTVVIETSAPATYQTRDVPSQNQVVIEIANARLPEHLRRPYITKDFKQSILSINAYQDPGSTTARVVVQFSGPTQAAVVQSGRSLKVSPSDIAYAATDSSVTKASTEYADAGMDIEPAIVRGGDADDPRILPSSSLAIDDKTDVRFYGKPVSIEVHDTPIREVISLIAEQSGANIILSSEVDGNLSLKLRQIPWDQALLLVMRSRNLGYVRQGSVLRIAPLVALQKEADEARQILEAQRASEPLKVKVIPVSYAKVDQLKEQVSQFLSQRGRVAGDPRTSSLLVTDLPENLERIANLVKALDAPPLQVLIEGKVVEARETFTRDFGINWTASGADTNLSGGLNLRSNLSVRPGPVNAGTNLGLQLGTLEILGDLDASLSLFESENLVKVISAPRVVTMNNEPASIVQGTNIPIPVTVQSGAGAPVTSQEYKPIELRLEVTPQITSGGNVIMQLLIKREFPGARATEGSTAPDINSREAKTRVMVRNGQTAVVGGVYQADTIETENGIPFLRKIPFLGWLFKSRGTSSDKTELLVFLTPRILNAEQTLPKESAL